MRINLPGLLKSKAALLIVFIIFLVLALPTFNFVLFATSPYQLDPERVSYFEVKKGDSPNDLTKKLMQIEVIGDPKTFIRLGRLTQRWKKLKAGEYQLSSAMSPNQIFSILTSGKSVGHPITIREGENMYEVAADLQSKGLASSSEFIRLCKDSSFIKSLGLFQDNPPPILEGYLFPETYSFPRTTTEQEMIRQMVKHFFDTWKPAFATRAKDLGLSLHQVATLASIIEKETGVPEERPIISSVFHNRLKKKMRLQSDPTTIYGMWEKYRGKISRSDLAVKNEYNTYQIPALPVGPISNPGAEAIKAALYPTESSFFYFVSHNDGTHHFSETLAEHNQAVQQFQLDPKARKGRSWRDYSRKNSSGTVKQHAPASLRP